MNLTAGLNAIAYELFLVIASVVRLLLILKCYEFFLEHTLLPDQSSKHLIGLSVSSLFLNVICVVFQIERILSFTVNLQRRIADVPVDFKPDFFFCQNILLRKVF